MNYNRLLLLIISIAACITMFYFLFGPDQQNKAIGYLAMLILIGTNALYFLYSKDWMR
ncbi:hypothetical protein [Sphingobacterium sp. 1.A.5]|uniref:hypothetical protein n=1 Tax=Sphingobacterium sp. 1.A.5 TaxID=2044604 RepID=UPI0015D4CECF|nr:hypothetical protein [Sphingobacterium sp. 1.A.5]